MPRQIPGYRAGTCHADGKAILAAKPKQKDASLADTGGLHLFVTRVGSKLWRHRCEIDGKEKRMSVSTYSDLKLTEA